ncbi:MAG: hypothetical protein GY772_00895, partial [bacterium]|nr:hypothetical protein [bacterium]
AVYAAELATGPVNVSSDEEAVGRPATAAHGPPMPQPAPEVVAPPVGGDGVGTSSGTVGVAAVPASPSQPGPGSGTVGVAAGPDVHPSVGGKGGKDAGVGRGDTTTPREWVPAQGEGTTGGAVGTAGGLPPAAVAGPGVTLPLPPSGGTSGAVGAAGDLEEWRGMSTPRGEDEATLLSPDFPPGGQTAAPYVPLPGVLRPPVPEQPVPVVRGPGAPQMFVAVPVGTPIQAAVAPVSFVQDVRVQQGTVDPPIRRLG